MAVAVYVTNDPSATPVCVTSVAGKEVVVGTNRPGAVAIVIVSPSNATKAVRMVGAGNLVPGETL